MKFKGRQGEAVLDDLDWQILQQLQEDAKQTYAEIGSKLNVAHSTIFERIKQMEEHGFIKKYEAVINLEKIGMPKITALLNVITDPKEAEEIAAKLAHFRQVLEVSVSFSEETIILLKVVAQDQGELHSFIAKSIAPLPGVLRIRTAIITKRYKEEHLKLPNANFSKNKE
jgi:Lrp/AsnC family leucine-responsive transcriptional regulator